MKSLEFKTFEEFYRAIPPEGSLGILAMGAAGVAAWRKKRQEMGLPRAASFKPPAEKPVQESGHAETGE